MIRNQLIIYPALFSLLFFIGCANTVKLQYESAATETMINGPRTTIAALSENWSDYNIYYAGFHPEQAKGILFDPKNDDKKLVPVSDEWVKVMDKKTLDTLVHWIADSRMYSGRLLKILGPDTQFFGYLYLHLDEPYTGARIVDKNTIEMLPIREMFNPVYYRRNYSGSP